MRKQQLMQQGDFFKSAGTIKLNAMRLTTSWTTSGLTWWNSPDSTTKHQATTSSLVSNGWYAIDITKIVRRWNVNMYPGYGVKIFDDVENNENVWATFYSSDYATASDGPKLVITVYTGTSDHVFNKGGIGKSFSFANKCTEHSKYVSQAVAAWNGSGADCNIKISSTSDNFMKEVDIDQSYYGVFKPQGNGKFEININKKIINRDAEWDKMYMSVMVHELGHALGLADLTSNDKCIMGKVDSNAFFYPSTGDIAGVNKRW